MYFKQTPHYCRTRSFPLQAQWTVCGRIPRRTDRVYRALLRADDPYQLAGEPRLCTCGQRQAASAAQSSRVTIALASPRSAFQVCFSCSTRPRTSSSLPFRLDALFSETAAKSSQSLKFPATNPCLSLAPRARVQATQGKLLVLLKNKSKPQNACQGTT